MHISLDGFVAGPNGEMGWIKFDEELFDHVGKRIGKGDTALYGRVTYQLMENYWPTAADKPNPSKHDLEHSAWYSKIRKVVLSNTLNENELTKTTIISNKIAERLNEIKDSKGDEILLFGSPKTTHELIKQNLIDGYWLFVNPIILGQGIPLFTDRSEETKLKLISSRPFGCGVTELNYLVDKN